MYFVVVYSWILVCSKKSEKNKQNFMFEYKACYVSDKISHKWLAGGKF